MFPGDHFISGFWPAFWLMVRGDPLTCLACGKEDHASARSAGEPGGSAAMRPAEPSATHPCLRNLSPASSAG